MQALPLFSEELIKELDDTVPERCADPRMTEREIWMYAGKRDLVRSLKMRLEESKQTILEGGGKLHA